MGPPSFGGYGDLLQSISIFIFVQSFELQVTSYRLQVTSYRLQVTGYKLQVTSYRLQVAGYKSGATCNQYLMSLIPPISLIHLYPVIVPFPFLPIVNSFVSFFHESESRSGESVVAL